MEDSHPPSLVKPMFIMAWRATWILGSGWLATGAVGVGDDSAEASSGLVWDRSGYRDPWCSSSLSFLSETTVHSSSSSDGVVAFLEASGSLSCSSTAAASSSFLASSSLFSSFSGVEDVEEEEEEEVA